MDSNYIYYYFLLLNVAFAVCRLCCDMRGKRVYHDVGLGVFGEADGKTV